jgi:hypothetical protein
MDDIEKSDNGNGDGWHDSEEARQKMSEAKKGTRSKSRRAVTLESRKKMSEALKRKWREPEYREKVSRAIRQGMGNKKKSHSDVPSSTAKARVGTSAREKQPAAKPQPAKNEAERSPEVFDT